MSSIPQSEGIDKLPVAELQADLEQFLQPVLGRLPEKRLRAVAKLAVQGILGGQIAYGDADGARRRARGRDDLACGQEILPVCLERTL